MKNALTIVAAAAVVAGIAAGCSSGGSSKKGPPNAVIGTLAGQTITMKSAAYVNVALSQTNAAYGTYTLAVMSDRADLDICTIVSGSAGFPGFPASSNFLIFNAGSSTGGSAPFGPATTPGQYTVAASAPLPSLFFTGRLFEFDSNCGIPGNAASATLQSGTVKVTSGSPDIVGSGSHIQADTGDSIGLNFDFASCPGMAVLVTNTSGMGYCIH